MDTVVAETSSEHSAAGSSGDGTKVISLDGPGFELADGSRLVPDGDGRPARIADGTHVFTLADALSEAAEPFAGYVRR